MRVSIPLPRRCERRTLPIELIPHICGYKRQEHVYDWLAEWSKALVLGTSLFGGVGSNPTPVTFASTSVPEVLSCGGLAQSVECVVRNDEAPGSKPGFSILLPI